MQELEQHIKRINKKLQQLLKNYTLLKKDNERQSLLIKELTRQKETATEQVNTLHQQVSILKASTGTMSDEDKKKFETHINQYLKEIDKCINFLSE